MESTLKKQLSKVRKLVLEHQFREAVKQARLLLLAEPRHIECRVLLAQSLIHLARYDEVVTETDVILELAPEDEEAWTLKGEALFFKGQYLPALRVLTRAAELRPEDQKIKRLMEEIKITHQPEADLVDDQLPRVTRPFPFPEEQGAEQDPTEITAEQTMPPVHGSDEEIEEPEPVEASADSTPKTKEKKKRSRRRKGKRSKKQAKAQLTTGKPSSKLPKALTGEETPSEDLLEVGDKTTVDELPVGLIADQSEDYQTPPPPYGEEEPTPSKTPVDPTTRIIGPPGKKQQKPALISGTAPEIEDLTGDMEEEGKEEPPRGAVVKFFSREQTLTVERVAVTTGEIASRSGGAADSPPPRMSVELGEGDTAPLELKPPAVPDLPSQQDDASVKPDAPFRPVESSQPDLVKRSRESPTALLKPSRAAPPSSANLRSHVAEDLEEMKGFFSPCDAPSGEERKIPGLPRALEPHEEDDALEDAPTSTYVNISELSPLPSLPSIKLSELSPNQIKPSVQAPSPAPAAVPRREEALPLPPPPPVRSRESHGTAKIPKPTRREHEGQAKAAPSAWPVKKILIAATAVAVVAVVAGVIHNRISRKNRSARLRSKSLVLMSRGDLHGLRAADEMLKELERYSSYRTEARAGRALVAMLLAVNFGVELSYARSLVQRTKFSDSPFSASAMILLFLADGKPDDALAMSEKAMARWPGHSWVGYATAVVLMNRGAAKDALTLLEKVQKDPLSPRFWIGVIAAFHMVLEHQFKSLTPLLNDLDKHFPGSPKVFVLDCLSHLMRCEQRKDCSSQHLSGCLTRLENASKEGWDRLHSAWAALLIARIALFLNRPEIQKRSTGLDLNPSPLHPEYAEMLAELLVSTRKTTEALSILLDLKKLYPGRISSSLLLSKVYLLKGEAKKAVSELDSIPQGIAGSRYYLIKARILMNLDRFSDAQEAVTKGLEKDPDDLDLNLSLVRVLLKRNQKQNALNRINQLRSRHKEHVDVLITAAEVLEASGKLPEAEAVLKLAITFSQQNVRAHFHLGKLSMKLMEWDQAEAHLSRAASLDPIFWPAWISKAELAYKLGKDPDVTTTLKKVFTSAPDHPRALLALANYLAATGQFDKARQKLDKVSAPHRKGLWHLIKGWIDVRQGRFGEAEPHLVKAKKTGTAEIRQNAICLMARSLIYQRRFSLVEKTLNELDKKSMKHPQVLLVRAQALLSRGKPLKAIDQLKPIIEAYEQKQRTIPRLTATAFAYYGRASYSSGAGRNAFRQFHKALTLHPSNALAKHLQGACEYEEGKEDDAYKTLTDAVKLDAGHAESYYYMGEILRNLKKTKKAAEYFRRYLKMRPRGELSSEAKKGLAAVQ